MGDFGIRPFAIAKGLQREMSRMTYLNFYGEKIDIPYICFYLNGEGKHILVDTGCSAKDYLEQVKRGSGKPLRAGGEVFKDVVDETPFEAMLDQLNLEAEQIDYVIQTHLHWDHCMNTVKVPNAKIIVHEKEVLGGLPPHCFFGFSYAPKDYYDRLQRMPGFTAIKGEMELLPGLGVIATPGHTPGGISVKVQTKKGIHIIAGLCTVNLNYYLPKELEGELGYSVIPPGCHTDPVQAYDSMMRIKREADRVLPLHEPMIMNEKVIGA